MNSVYKPNNKLTKHDEYIETLFPNIRHELMEESEQSIDLKNLKSPELSIKINNIHVNALIDTGSSLNALSEKWYNNNQKKLGNHEILSVNNTTIVSAIGNKSKHVRKQIFCEICINNSVSFDCVFLIIPGLVRECILLSLIHI